MNECMYVCMYTGRKGCIGFRTCKNYGPPVGGPHEDSSAFRSTLGSPWMEIPHARA